MNRKLNNLTSINATTTEVWAHRNRSYEVIGNHTICSTLWRLHVLNILFSLKDFALFGLIHGFCAKDMTCRRSSLRNTDFVTCSEHICIYHLRIVNWFECPGGLVLTAAGDLQDRFSPLLVAVGLHHSNLRPNTLVQYISLLFSWHVDPDLHVCLKDLLSFSVNPNYSANQYMLPAGNVWVSIMQSNDK